MNGNNIKGSGSTSGTFSARIFARSSLLLFLIFACLLPGCSWLQWPSSGEQFFSEGFVRPTPKYLPVPSGKSGDRAITINPGGLHYHPVGSEVILVGGIVGDDNYYKTGRTVEWTLSQESVGQFLDVGKKDPIDWILFNFTNPRRVDNNYAITSTINNYHVLNRGTPTTVDDVRIQAGQTWVSVMSTSPGISRVTAKGPSVQTWQGRTATATIVWVDAQWQFPSVAIVSPGSSHPLVTRITRHNGCGPASGNWMVQYTIDDACPAVFTPDGTKSVTVGLDSTGAATAVIAPVDGASCATVPVTVSIIPPPEVADTPFIDRGSTTVTWATTPSPEVATPPTFSDGTSVPTIATPPGEGMDPTLPSTAAPLPPSGTQLPNVLLQVVGPPQVEVGKEFQVHVTVTNNGDRTTPKLDLVDTYGEGLEHPRTSQNPIAVEVGQLEPGAEQGVVINFLATKEGELEHTVRVEANGQEIATRTDAITAVAAGSGSGIGDWQSEPGETTVPNIPGLTPPSGDGTLSPSGTGEGTTGQGTVKISIVGPPSGTVGENALFSIEVANQGSQPIKGVRVFERHDSRQLKVVSLSEDFKQAENGTDYYWDIPEMAPQKIYVLKVGYEPVVAESRIQVQTEATAGGTTIAEAKTSINVQAGSGGPIAPPVQPDINPPGGGGAGPMIGPPAVTPGSTAVPGYPAPEELTLEIADRNDNIEVGNDVYYEIYIRNNSNHPDTQVQLSVYLPEGMVLNRLKTSGYTPLKSFENQVVEFEPVDELPAGKELSYRVVASYNQVGTVLAKAEVRSSNLPQPIVDDQRTEFHQSQ